MAPGSRPADRPPRLVVGLDGSRSARAALCWALRTAALRGASVETLSTFPVDRYTSEDSPPAPERVDGLRRAIEARARAAVAQARRDPGIRAVEGAEDVAVHVVVLPGPAAEQLLARSRDADLLIVGSRGRGAVPGALIGAVPLRCVMHADCPVVVVDPDRTSAFHPGAGTVVVGVDGSPAARAALEDGVRETQYRRARLVAVAAVEPTDPWTGLPGPAPQVEEMCRRVRSEVAAEVADVLSGIGTVAAPPVEVVVVEGAPADVLVRWSERAELLVVGSQGRGALPGVVLGSVALRTVIRAACPVMVVHPRPVPVPDRRQATSAEVLPRSRAGTKVP